MTQRRKILSEIFKRNVNIQPTVRIDYGRLYIVRANMAWSTEHQLASCQYTLNQQILIRPGFVINDLLCLPVDGFTKNTLTD